MRLSGAPAAGIVVSQRRLPHASSALSLEEGQEAATSPAGTRDLVHRPRRPPRYVGDDGGIRMCFPAFSRGRTPLLRPWVLVPANRGMCPVVTSRSGVCVTVRSIRVASGFIKIGGSRR